MAQITFTIPSDKIDRLVTAIATRHPIPTEKDDEGEDVPAFTAKEWTKEYVRRLLVREVRAYEREQAAHAVSADDDLVS
jgi:hypothetical protein